MSDILFRAIQEKLSSKNLTLPVYDAVASELQHLLSTPGSSMHAIADVIEKDPNLSAQVLRVANSAQFIAMGEATTLTGALIRLGARQICSIVTMVTQHRNFHVKDPFISAYVTRLWEHSVSCAISSRWLAMRVGRRSDADEAFTGGLMHDFGMLLILRVMAEADLPPEEKKKAPVEDILFALHCRIGERLLEEWRLPVIYREIAKKHHDAEPASPLLAIITFCDTVVTNLGIGLEKLPVSDPMQSKQAKFLNVDKSLLNDLEKVVKESMTLAGKLY